MNLRFLAIALAISLSVSACQPETVYLYEVNPVSVSQAGVNKENQKSDLEFLSLAYADLIGTTIPNQDLNRMVAAYTAMGDKTLIADILIRNLINDPQAQVPSDAEMRSDVAGFIQDTYKKFYLREPGEYERWYLQNMIESDAQITPQMIYYAFLTSAEYRYY